MISPSFKGGMVNSWSRSWRLSTPIVTGTHRIYLRDTAGRKCHCLIEWMKLLTTGVIGMMVMYHIQSWKLLYRVASSDVAIYCFGPLKTEFISGLIDLTFIDIILLECLEVADIILSGLRCTFALRSAYSIAHWLHFYTLSLQYVRCPAQPVFHWCFPRRACTLLRFAYCLNEQETKCVSIYQNDNLRPQVKNETSSVRVVLNGTQWFILVTFKDHVPKDELHKLCDSRHILPMYCV